MSEGKQMHTAGLFDIEQRLPTRGEAAFAARVLSHCNGHDLDVWTGGNWPGDAGEWLTPLAQNGELTLPELLGEVECRWPGSFWHLAKGRMRSDEPLFGFQVLFGSDDVLAEGEGDSIEAAIRSALSKPNSTSGDV